MNKLNNAKFILPVVERLQKWFCWLSFLFFSTFLLLDRAVYNLLFLFLLVIATVIAFVYRPQLDKDLKFLAWVLVANLLFAIPNLILGRDGIISLENPVRMLIMIPLILAVVSSGFRIKFLSVGLSIGMIAAALAVSWQYFILNQDRPGIHYNPLLFSEIAMSAFAVLLAASIVFRDRLGSLYLAGLLAALYCVVISGARGTLIAFVPIVLYLGWLWLTGSTLDRLFSSRRVLWLSVLLLILIGSLASSSLFIGRINTAVKQTTDYFENGSADTSVSIRLELWRGALMAGNEHPLLGIGFRDRDAFFENKIANGELKPYVKNKRHAHNDYMNAYQSRGIPGLLLQLLIYAAPILIFTKGLSGEKNEKLLAALAGMLVTIGYATYSLTEVPMHNGLPLVFYIVITSILIGIVKHKKNSDDAGYSRQFIQ